jgi:hypothetical protein
MKNEKWKRSWIKKFQSKLYFSIFKYSFRKILNYLNSKNKIIIKEIKF